MDKHAMLCWQIAEIASDHNWDAIETLRNIAYAVDGFDGLPCSNADFIAVLRQLATGE